MLEKIGGEIDLLQHHLTVLHEVVEHGPIGIIKLTDVLHDSQHHIRYSLRVLEQMGYIRATSSGAVATPKAFAMLENFDVDLDVIVTKLGQFHSDNKNI